MSSNDDYLDAALRHAVGVQRLTAGEVRKILTLLSRADAELVAKLRKRLRANMTTAQVKALIKDIAEIRKVLIAQLHDDLRGSLHELAPAEVAFETKLLNSVLPIDITLAGVEASVLRAAVTAKPFAGKTLGQWFKGLEQADQGRLMAALQLGIAQGESVDSIVRRVAGTKKANWKDGVLAVSRRNAEAIVRTAISHISNSAREAMWDANADIIDGLMWVSTLDGRTTPICQSNDGKVASVGGKPIPRNSTPLLPPGSRPPAHVKCRSLMVAVLSAAGVALRAGVRPFVRATGVKRNFRSEAKEAAGERWSRMTKAQRDAAAKSAARSWANDAVGTVPASTTYSDWMARQPLSFQVEVLGEVRAKLFRDGGLSLDAFVDIRGKEYTIAQLAADNPDAFIRAGLA